MAGTPALLHRMGCRRRRGKRRMDRRARLAEMQYLLHYGKRLRGPPERRPWAECGVADAHDVTLGEQGVGNSLVGRRSALGVSGGATPVRGALPRATFRSLGHFHNFTHGFGDGRSLAPLAAD